MSLGSEKEVTEKRKLERCILKVKARLPKTCKTLGYPAGTVKYKGRKVRCFNPWAVCRSRLSKR